MSQEPDKEQADEFLDLWERNILAWWRETASLAFPPLPDEASGRKDGPKAAGAPHGDGGDGMGRCGGSGRGGAG